MCRSKCLLGSLFCDCVSWIKFLLICESWACDKHTLLEQLQLYWIFHWENPKKENMTNCKISISKANMKFLTDPQENLLRTKSAEQIDLCSSQGFQTFFKWCKTSFLSKYVGNVCIYLQKKQIQIQKKRGLSHLKYKLRTPDNCVYRQPRLLLCVV